MAEKLYTAQEAADRLQVTKRTMQNWLRQGLFPGAYKQRPGSPTSPYRVPESDLARFEKQRQSQ